tara:strand:- start:11658 stop:12293 length:636 start_codon:yes stop_codon:yes gene_type:complete
MKISHSSNEFIQEIAEVHISSFPNSISSLLGKSYVVSMLNWYIKTENAFLFHVSAGNDIVGYCGALISDGMRKNGSSTRIFQLTFFDLFLSFLKKPWLIFKINIPQNILFIIKNILIKFKKLVTQKNIEKDLDKERLYISIISIGVKDDYLGKGYGNALLKELEIHSIKKNIDLLKLSVKKTNNRAIRAYKRQGWIVVSEGKINLQLIKKL